MESLIKLYPQYLPKDIADEAYAHCLGTIPFEEQHMTFFKRLTYRYDFEDSIPILDKLAKDIGQKGNRIITGVWCNYYRNGSDQASFHKDSYGCDIFTLSLGGTRDCHFRPDAAGEETLRYSLSNGDLLYFNQAANGRYKHSKKG